MSDIKKTTKKLLVTSALSLALIGATQLMFEDVKAEDVEKCYGIAKAGQNDCAAGDGSHTCSGLSVKDAQAGDWIALPKGICDRIVGGTTATKTTDEKAE